MTPNEVEIYLALLHNKELSVNEIGNKAGLHRQVCYDALERLLEKGFVAYVIKDKKKFFNALNPNKLLDYLDEKKQDINEILPQLITDYETEKEETQVEVIKGKRILHTIYEDIIKTVTQTKQPMLAMGIEETKFLEFDELTIRKYIENLKKNNLKERLLSKVSATYFFEGLQSEYRLLPDYLFNPNPTHIYGDKIAIIVWGHPAYCIIIKNKQVADANRKYFEILWKTAKKKS